MRDELEDYVPDDWEPHNVDDNPYLSLVFTHWVLAYHKRLREACEKLGKL